MARETLAGSSRFAAAMATPAMNGSFFEWRDPAGSASSSSGSFPANYPNTWLRLKRSGNTFTGYASYDGQTWTQLGSDTISMPEPDLSRFFREQPQPRMPSPRRNSAIWPT